QNNQHKGGGAKGDWLHGMHPVRAYQIARLAEMTNDERMTPVTNDGLRMREESRVHGEYDSEVGTWVPRTAWKPDRVREDPVFDVHPSARVVVREPEPKWIRSRRCAIRPKIPENPLVWSDGIAIVPRGGVKLAGCCIPRRAGANRRVKVPAIRLSS